MASIGLPCVNCFANSPQLTSLHQPLSNNKVYKMPQNIFDFLAYFAIFLIYFAFFDGKATGQKNTPGVNDFA
jgi:hypothetical protein